MESESFYRVGDTCRMLLFEYRCEDQVNVDSPYQNDYKSKSRLETWWEVTSSVSEADYCLKWLANPPNGYVSWQLGYLAFCRHPEILEKARNSLVAQSKTDAAKEIDNMMIAFRRWKSGSGL